MTDDRAADRRPTDDPGPDRVEALLRRAGSVESAPPDHVWASIRAEVDSSVPEISGEPASLRPRGPRPARWPLLAAAAVGALVAWVGTAVLGGVSEDEVVVADATLEDLPEAGAAIEGTAEVVTVDGERRLRLQLAERPDAGEGYLEVWLLRPDVSGMVTVGVISGTEAEFALPDGVDVSEYPVVDISREQLDGDPTHGGRSVVRGELSEASAGPHGPPPRD
ncbi:anti-sigma factor [Serinicoccus kebangsaanensis]|uniref:anti-sigma factor n=1 Tax=Serinicoccus kebangsaanensis TaxID=2602069 RepID=UPI00124CC844|nr:anti-sigma factor [Serinicoccus kebangsaanensis]